MLCSEIEGTSILRAMCEKVQQELQKQRQRPSATSGRGFRVRGLQQHQSEGFGSRGMQVLQSLTKNRLRASSQIRGGSPGLNRWVYLPVCTHSATKAERTKVGSDTVCPEPLTPLRTNLHTGRNAASCHLNSGSR